MTFFLLYKYENHQAQSQEIVSCSELLIWDYCQHPATVSELQRDKNIPLNSDSLIKLPSNHSVVNNINPIKGWETSPQVLLILSQLQKRTLTSALQTN